MINSDDYSTLALQETIRIEHNEVIPFEELIIKNTLPVEKVIADYKIRDSIWKMCCERFATSVKPFENVECLVSQLVNCNCSIGIVTSRRKKDLKQFRNTELGKRFKQVVCFEDCLEHKPSSEPIKYYLNKFLITNTDTLYIGDSYCDMLSAKGANVAFGLALWNPNTQNIEGADFQLNNALDVLKLI